MWLCFCACILYGRSRTAGGVGFALPLWSELRSCTARQKSTSSGSSTNTQVAGVSNDLNKQRPVSSVRRLRSGDVPHLLAHMSLTITHLLLVEAYSQLH
ncbi:hypothetical protein PR002_g21020 [Phytophthora rubi]|nr:hypothetical protein PR002_g21020 [Phytophthora rubi]